MEMVLLNVQTPPMDTARPDPNAVKVNIWHYKDAVLQLNNSDST